MPTKRKADVVEAATDWLLLHARLLGVDTPYVWRQMLVPSDLTLDKLHALMQAAFGWASCHHHGFTVKRVKQLGRNVDGDLLTHVTKRNPDGFKVPPMELLNKPVYSLHTY